MEATEDYFMPDDIDDLGTQWLKAFNKINKK